MPEPTDARYCEIIAGHLDMPQSKIAESPTDLFTQTNNPIYNQE
jgi:hypothetical protein